MPPKVSWQEKVRARIGYPAHGAVSRLARLLHQPVSNVRNWLVQGNKPLDEAVLLSELSRALRVPESWLRDGKPGEPPAIPEVASSTWIATVDAMPWPPRVKQLAYALVDREAVEWLADAYERLYLPTRARRGSQ